MHFANGTATSVFLYCSSTLAPPVAMPTYTTTYQTVLPAACETSSWLATYTITETCTGNPAAHPTAAAGPPPGFVVTTVKCPVCAEPEMTVTCPGVQPSGVMPTVTVVATNGITATETVTLATKPTAGAMAGPAAGAGSAPAAPAQSVTADAQGAQNVHKTKIATAHVTATAYLEHVKSSEAAAAASSSMSSSVAYAAGCPGGVHCPKPAPASSSSVPAPASSSSSMHAFKYYGWNSTAPAHATGALVAAVGPTAGRPQPTGGVVVSPLSGAGCPGGESCPSGGNPVLPASQPLGGSYSTAGATTLRGTAVALLSALAFVAGNFVLL